MTGGEPAEGREHPFSRILVIGPDTPLAHAALDHVAPTRCRVVEPREAPAVAAEWQPTTALLTLTGLPDLDLLRMLLRADPALAAIAAAEAPLARAALKAGVFAVVPPTPSAGDVRAALADLLREEDEQLMPAPP